LNHIFLDIDTQLDFLLPAGALYAPGAEAILPNLGRLTAQAVKQGVPLVSTMDAHAEDDAEFADWPPHCVAGTIGQKKAAATIAARGQEFVLKRSVDCFTNPEMERILARLQPGRVFVYGVVTDVCVRCAVDGLLERNYQVGLVTDAIQPIDAEAAEQAMARWRFAGVKMVTTASLCG
jgi:nicotinamidase/pyrazinamidase